VGTGAPLRLRASGDLFTRAMKPLHSHVLTQQAAHAHGVHGRGVSDGPSPMAQSRASSTDDDERRRRRSCASSAKRRRQSRRRGAGWALGAPRRLIVTLEPVLSHHNLSPVVSALSVRIAMLMFTFFTSTSAPLLLCSVQFTCISVLRPEVRPLLRRRPAARRCRTHDTDSSPQAT